MQHEINANRISDELEAHDQWICWTIVEQQGVTAMMPNNPHTGNTASTTNPDHRGSLDVATKTMAEENLTGIGYVFSEDGPFVGVDIDNCRDPETGDIEDWALDILQTIGGWMEISPSGRGIHIIVSGEHPGDETERRHGYMSENGKVEIYDRDQFFTVTGDLINENGNKLNDSDETPEITKNQQDLNTVYNSFT